MDDFLKRGPRSVMIRVDPDFKALVDKVSQETKMNSSQVTKMFERKLKTGIALTWDSIL